jgi:hypothetical protein
MFSLLERIGSTVQEMTEAIQDTDVRRVAR